MYLGNTCNLHDFSAYSRVSHNSENGVESDDLLFPIEEVVDNTSVENINSESGNMTSHAIYEHLCTHLKYILETWFNCIWKKNRWTEDGIKINFQFKERNVNQLFSAAPSSEMIS